MVGMAWADEDFRQRLLADPDRAITALGIDTTGAGRIRVVEEAPGETLLVVPRRPEHLAAMSAEELNNEKWICTTGNCVPADGDSDDDDDDDPDDDESDPDEDDEDDE
jgi:hypothetical protein